MSRQIKNLGGLVFNRLTVTGDSGARSAKHEHRVVAEAMIGRPLKSDEHVHHKDENKHNNSPENLEVMHWLDHLRLHGQSAKRRA